MTEKNNEILQTLFNKKEEEEERVNKQTKKDMK